MSMQIAEKMQSKISAFFKSPSPSSASASASPPKPLPLHNDDDDPLSTWENTQHNIFITYSKRSRPNPIALEASSSKPQPTITGATVVKNKKRSYAQIHLDFGQSDFLLRTCSTCGLKFTPGDVDGEKDHKDFHKLYTQGIQFRGWTNERVVPMSTVKSTSRIVVVLDTDPPAHRNKVEEVVKMMEIELGSEWILHQLCKVYLFISQQRIVGCVVAEPIKEAFKVVSCSIAGHSDSAKKRETRSSSSTTLQFGNIVFRREVKKRAVSVSDSEAMDGSRGGAIFCESKSVAAVCGIRAIWVTPSNRRKGIAGHLLDAVRKSFCAGSTLELTQLAFSQPTSAGKALASSYTGTGSFLVYKADKTVIDKEKRIHQAIS